MKNLVPRVILQISTLLSLSMCWHADQTMARSNKRKSVVFIASDLKNESVGVLYREFKVAATVLGWGVKLLNADGSNQQIKQFLASAIHSRADGVILGGFQIDGLENLGKEAQAKGVVLVGWHSAPEPGPQEYLFANVTTSADKVARLAYQYAVDTFHARVGVILINDPNFSIANEKTRQLALMFRGCPHCEVLSIEDVPITKAGLLMPSLIFKWNSRYGQKWTHTVAINDSYFNHSNIPLSEIKRKDIINISAGDGSPTALSRIRSGLSQHKAVVADPIREQGWQIAHEFFRAFSGQRWSGRITLPLLVAKETLANRGSTTIEDPVAYQTYFKNEWFSGVSGQSEGKR